MKINTYLLFKYLQWINSIITITYLVYVSGPTWLVVLLGLTLIIAYIPLAKNKFLPDKTYPSSWSIMYLYLILSIIGFTADDWFFNLNFSLLMIFIFIDFSYSRRYKSNIKKEKEKLDVDEYSQ